MLDVFAVRPEPLAFLVFDGPCLVHDSHGDKAHRFCLRDGSRPIVVRAGVGMPVRSVSSMLAMDRRVAVLIDDLDDVPHAARRLIVSAPAFVHDMPTALWDGSAWTSSQLKELV